MTRRKWIKATLAALAATGAAHADARIGQVSARHTSHVASPSAEQQPTYVEATIVARHPHDATAYTEGLLFHDGSLYESTGGEQVSDIRRVRINDGAVVQRMQTVPGLFGEGIVDWKGSLISLTWKSGRGFRWDLASFRRQSEFRYPGEGWALTRDAAHIYMSDGTSTLRVLDPATMKRIGTIHVTSGGKDVGNLNELEWVDGEIWANVWLTAIIARIDPKTGFVKGWVDLAAAAAEQGSDDPNAVANGIAWDPVGRRLFVTGKRWKTTYEISVPGVTGTP